MVAIRGAPAALAARVVRAATSGGGEQHPEHLGPSGVPRGNKAANPSDVSQSSARWGREERVVPYRSDDRRGPTTLTYRIVRCGEAQHTASNECP
jgi:hypothetical protein